MGSSEFECCFAAKTAARATNGYFYTSAHLNASLRFPLAGSLFELANVRLNNEKRRGYIQNCCRSSLEAYFHYYID